MEESDRIRSILLKHLKLQHVQVLDGKIVNVQDALEKLFKAIENNRTTFHELLFKIVEPVDKNKYVTVCYFKEATRLDYG